MSREELDKVVALKESLEKNIEQFEGRKKIIAGILEICPTAGNVLASGGLDGPPMDPRQVLACMDLQVEIYQCIISGMDAQILSQAVQEAA